MFDRIRITTNGNAISQAGAFDQLPATLQFSQTTQQSAANAEEFAATAEEVSSQAEPLQYSCVSSGPAPRPRPRRRRLGAGGADR